MEGLEKKLADLGTSLEGKSKEQVDLAIKAFKAEFEKEVDTKAQKVFDNKIDAFKSKMEGEFETKIKVVQDQADKLSAKLKKGPSRLEKKSFNEVLANQFDDQKEEIIDFMEKKTGRVVLDLKAVGDMTTGNVSGTRYGELHSPNIIQATKRKVHLRELIPGGSIGPGNSFTFMREVGRGEGAPGQVAESEAKPQFDMDLEEATVPVENTAGWMRVTNKALRNIPGFLSFLQTRIPEKFERVIDGQILYGTGADNQHKGILTAGNFVASTSTTDNVLVEKLIDDIALLEDTYERDANGILLRPIDYYGFFKNKASGSGEYDLPQGLTWDGRRLSLFGIPIYASTAINAPDYVVGDWNEGAQWLTQDSMKIEFFRQDADNVTKNKVTVRVEGDYAFPVYGPDYFIKGSSEIVAPV